MPRQFKLMFIFLLMLSSALIGVTVFADDYGLGATAQEAGLAKYESNLPKLVGQVVGAALSLTGVLFFGLMIYSGIIWMIDRGNDERAEQAKNTITAAIIGLVIVLAAYAITKFAFEAVPQSGGGGVGTGTVVGSGGQGSGNSGAGTVTATCGAPNECLPNSACEGTGPFQQADCAGGSVCCVAKTGVISCEKNSDCPNDLDCYVNSTGNVKECMNARDFGAVFGGCCIESVNGPARKEAIGAATCNTGSGKGSYYNALPSQCQ